MSGFYDYNAAIDTPISDIYDMFTIATVYGKQQNWDVKVKENRVIYLNGTTETFYSLSSKHTYDNNHESNLFILTLKLDSEIDIYEQYTIHEPNETRRNLDITTTENYTYSYNSYFESEHMGERYEKLFYLSRVGGLLALLYFIFRCIISTYERKVHTFESVNKYQRTAALKIEENDEFMADYYSKQDGMEDVNNSGINLGIKSKNFIIVNLIFR